MKKTVMIGLSAGLVVLGVVAWAVMHGAAIGDDPLPVAPPDAVASDMEVMDAPEAARLPAMKPPRPEVSPTVAVHSVLPPMDMPFNQSVEALEEAARKGDPVAACRITAEAWRCQGARPMMAYMSNEELQIRSMAHENHDARQLEEKIDLLLKRKQALEKILASCEGVDVSITQLSRYDQRAAAAGDSFARIRYLRGGHLSPANVLRHPELLDHYRTHAYGYFMQALEAGDLGVLQLWQGSIQMEDASALSAVLPEAWRDKGLVAALIDQLTNSQRMPFAPHDAFTPKPTPEQRAEAARLYKRYFANTDPATYYRSFPRFSGDGMIGENPERCEGLVH